jgi:hypothetical protein
MTFDLKTHVWGSCRKKTSVVQLGSRIIPVSQPHVHSTTMSPRESFGMMRYLALRIDHWGFMFAPTGADPTKGFIMCGNDYVDNKSEYLWTDIIAPEGWVLDSMNAISEYNLKFGNEHPNFHCRDDQTYVLSLLEHLKLDGNAVDRHIKMFTQ